MRPSYQTLCNAHTLCHEVPIIVGSRYDTTSKSVRTPTSTNLFTLMLPLYNKNRMEDGRRASSFKSPTRLPVARILRGSLSRGIISFGKALALSLKLMPMHERRRFLKGANLLLLCIHLQWIQVALFATPLFYF